MTNIVKKHIPSLNTVQDKQVANILDAIKQNIEIITGANTEPITQLSSGATLSQVIATVNQIIIALNQAGA